MYYMKLTTDQYNALNNRREEFETLIHHGYCRNLTNEY